MAHRSIHFPICPDIGLTEQFSIVIHQFQGSFRQYLPLFHLIPFFYHSLPLADHQPGNNRVRRSHQIAGTRIFFRDRKHCVIFPQFYGKLCTGDLGRHPQNLWIVQTDLFLQLAEGNLAFQNPGMDTRFLQICHQGIVCITVIAFKGHFP